MRKWREIHSLQFLIFSLFPSSLSISYIKNCLILQQNVKYGTFVANVTKNLTYALRGNNSGSNSLRGSSASCAGLTPAKKNLHENFRGSRDKYQVWMTNAHIYKYVISCDIFLPTDCEKEISSNKGISSGSSSIRIGVQNVPGGCSNHLTTCETILSKTAILQPM